MNDTTLQMLEEIAGARFRKDKPGGSAAIVPADALVPDGDQALRIGHYRLTPVGLEVDPEVTFDEWRNLGALLFALEGSIQWLIGDWILNGEFQWGQTYDQIAAIVDREVSTLYEYVHVARHVQFLARAKNLSFRHHKLVASLPEAEQRHWLDEAERNGWSIAAMRAAMKPKSATSAAALPPDAVTLKTNFAYILNEYGNRNRLDREGKAELRRRVVWMREYLARIENELG